jgi:hypothetical protein
MGINRRDFILLSGMSALAIPGLKLSADPWDGKITPESWFELNSDQRSRISHQ